MLMCHEREVTCFTKKKRMICPWLSGLSATCHCRIGAKCHDRQVRQMSILITTMYPLKSTAEIFFGSPNSGKIKSQTSSSSMHFYPELRIWRRMALVSTAKIPSGLRAPGKSKLKSLFFPFAFLWSPRSSIACPFKSDG
jgi:hypothetical protein